VVEMNKIILSYGVIILTILFIRFNHCFYGSYKYIFNIFIVFLAGYTIGFIHWKEWEEDESEDDEDIIF
jgi:hypothetical protein